MDREHIMQLTVLVRRVAAQGGSADDAAVVALAHTNSPISAILALRHGLGLEPADAKELMHRNLRPDVRAAAEQLWRDLIAALEDAADERDAADGSAEP